MSLYRMYITIKWPHLFACVCPRKGGLIVFGCLQLLPWRMQFHLSFIFPHLDCIRINCNASKFSLKFHFVLSLWISLYTNIWKRRWHCFLDSFINCFFFSFYCVFSKTKTFLGLRCSVDAEGVQDLWWVYVNIMRVRVISLGSNEMLHLLAWQESIQGMGQTENVFQ